MSGRPGGKRVFSHRAINNKLRSTSSCIVGSMTQQVTASTFMFTLIMSCSILLVQGAFCKSTVPLSFDTGYDRSHFSSLYGRSRRSHIQQSQIGIRCLPSIGRTDQQRFLVLGNVVHSDHADPTSSYRRQQRRQQHADYHEGEVDEAQDDEYDNEDDDDETRTYKINLQLAQLARDSSRHNRTPAYEAYDLFRTEQINPDTVAYNSVLKALAKTSSPRNKNAASIAQELLEEMESLNVKQVEENQLWYQNMEEGLLSQEELSRGPPRIRVKPNVRTYSTVMDAWGKQGNLAGAQQALRLLKQLQEKHDNTGDVAVQPNVISYNTVMNAWAKAGAKEEGAQQCEDLLHEMGTEMADVISYNAALHAWARSGLPDAGERAESLLREMWHVEPNARSYTTVMDAWSRSYGTEDSAKRAHMLLTEIEELSEAAVANRRNIGGDDNNGRGSISSYQYEMSMTPNIISYSTVIHAYALSKSEPFKAHKAFSLLQRIVRLSKENPKLRPNRVTYNCVLNACATSCPILFQDKIAEENLDLPTLPDMVRTLYGELLDNNFSVEPDHYTFGTVLKAVATLFWGEPDQLDFCKKVFQDACERGQVSYGVMIQLRHSAPVEVYRELLPPDAYDAKSGRFLMKKIPNNWTRNVRDDSSRQDRNKTKKRNSRSTRL